MLSPRAATVTATVLSSCCLVLISIVLPLTMLRLQRANTFALDKVHQCRIESESIWSQLASVSSGGRQKRSGYSHDGHLQAFRPSGKCCSCQQGPPGPPGSSGQPGTDGEPGLIGTNGRNGHPGRYVVPPKNHELSCQKCPPAVQGPPGHPGLKGPRGNAGAAGGNGTPGTPGRPGPPGPPGVRGAPGEIGIQGPPGNQGRVLNGAPPGPPGTAGKMGPRGKAGLAGADGHPGATGLPGFRGEQGSRGGNGQAGLPGPTGPPGPAGPRGTCSHCAKPNPSQHQSQVPAAREESTNEYSSPGASAGTSYRSASQQEVTAAANPPADAGDEYGASPSSSIPSYESHSLESSYTSGGNPAPPSNGQNAPPAPVPYALAAPTRIFSKTGARARTQPTRVATNFANEPPAYSVLKPMRSQARGEATFVGQRYRGQMISNQRTADDYGFGAIAYPQQNPNPYGSDRNEYRGYESQPMPRGWKDISGAAYDAAVRYGVQPQQSVPRSNGDQYNSGK